MTGALFLGLSLHFMQCPNDSGHHSPFICFGYLTSNEQKVKRDPTPLLSYNSQIATKTMDRWNAISASDHSLEITLHGDHKDSGFWRWYSFLGEATASNLNISVAVDGSFRCMTHHEGRHLESHQLFFVVFLTSKYKNLQQPQQQVTLSSQQISEIKI